MSDLTVLDALVLALQSAATYDKNDQAAPVAVLWPDKNREWEAVVSRLRGRLPILTLGRFEPNKWSGPAIWLRCVLAGQVEGPSLADGESFVLYFPGVSRDELRAVEDLNSLLQPITELQYRGAWWSHPNGRDWSVAAFFSNKQKGLDLDLRDDAATTVALTRALNRVLDEPVESLRGRKLESTDFDALLNPDEKRSLLLWMSDSAGFKAGRTESEWDAFSSACKGEFAFNPDTDGVLTAAQRLGARQGKWGAVWDRYAEAAQNFPGVAVALDQARPHELVPVHPESWPSINEEHEVALRGALASLAEAHPADASATLAELEKQHGERRDWLWGCLGKAPLAHALEQLIALASVASEGWKQGDAASIATQYAEHGWRADDALMRALAEVEKAEDALAVKSAADVLYRVWLQQGATALQASIATGAPAAVLPGTDKVETGTCVLFTDGLRMDVGHRLLNRLVGAGCDVELLVDVSALPPVTGTAKPSVSPVASQLGSGPDFDPSAPGSQGRLTADGLRKLLKAAGWQVLEAEGGDPSGRAWTECGDIDQFGHSHGWKLARSLDAEVGEIAQRVEALLAWGWARVVVVTDHGWLLVPGGLQKVDLPEHLTEQRKGRCARLKPGASTDFLTLPWRWNSDVRVAYAPGVSTFVAGQEYDHGGLSPQECVVPRLIVTRAGESTAVAIQIESVAWTGMRCRLQLSDGGDGLRVDVRTNAAQPSSSLLTSPATVKGGTASPLVEDDEMVGTAVCLVVLDDSGAVIRQATTVVGGES